MAKLAVDFDRAPSLISVKNSNLFFVAEHCGQFQVAWALRTMATVTPSNSRRGDRTDRFPKPAAFGARRAQESLSNPERTENPNTINFRPRDEGFAGARRSVMAPVRARRIFVRRRSARWAHRRAGSRRSNRSSAVWGPTWA
jgi:hypothetical protein